MTAGGDRGTKAVSARPVTMRSRTALTVALFGVVLVAGTPLLAALLDGPDAVGASIAEAATGEGSGAVSPGGLADLIAAPGAREAATVGTTARRAGIRTASRTPPEIAASTASRATPPPSTRSARLAEQPPPAERPQPVRLRAASAGIDVPVEPTGVETDGDMEIPDDVRIAGWYRFGPVPGERGSAVVTAHVDSYRQGAGPFQRLGDLAPGDEVEVDLSDGSTGRFVVVGRERLEKEQVPLDAVFRRTGPPMLTLVTCGGDFDPTARRYAANVIVTAVPVG